MFCPTDFSSHIFYVLLMIHISYISLSNNILFRPIISTIEISKCLGAISRCFFITQKSYTKNYTDFVEKLKDIYISNHSIVDSFDRGSMYTYFQWAINCFRFYSFWFGIEDWSWLLVPSICYFFSIFLDWPKPVGFFWCFFFLFHVWLVPVSKNKFWFLLNSISF